MTYPRKDLLLEIPVKSRIPWAVFEHGKLKADGHCLALEQVDGVVEIPPAAFSALLLEPGISITHDAVKLCSENSTLLIWMGEGGTQIYSAGNIDCKPENLIRQVRIQLSMKDRIEAARRMYRLMFNEGMPPSYSIEKLRGLEGAKVKAWYSHTTQAIGLNWSGKSSGDDISQTIAYANGCLYALCEIAIRILGYSPCLGIVHSGDKRSMVFDLADTLKFNGFLQNVLQEHKINGMKNYPVVRRFCRDHFRKTDILQNAVENMRHIFDDANSSSAE